MFVFMIFILNERRGLGQGTLVIAITRLPVAITIRQLWGRGYPLINGVDDRDEVEAENSNQDAANKPVEQAEECQHREERGDREQQGRVYLCTAVKLQPLGVKQESQRKGTEDVGDRRAHDVSQGQGAAALQDRCNDHGELFKGLARIT